MRRSLRRHSHVVEEAESLAENVWSPTHAPQVRNGRRGHDGAQRGADGESAGNRMPFREANASTKKKTSATPAAAASTLTHTVGLTARLQRPMRRRRSRTLLETGGAGCLARRARGRAPKQRGGSQVRAAKAAAQFTMERATRYVEQRIVDAAFAEPSDDELVYAPNGDDALETLLRVPDPILFMRATRDALPAWLDERADEIGGPTTQTPVGWPWETWPIERSTSATPKVPLLDDSATLPDRMMCARAEGDAVHGRGCSSRSQRARDGLEGT
jgi:hypothetical protein